MAEPQPGEGQHHNKGVMLRVVLSDCYEEPRQLLRRKGVLLARNSFRKSDPSRRVSWQVQLCNRISSHGAERAEPLLHRDSGEQPAVGVRHANATIRPRLYVISP